MVHRYNSMGAFVANSVFVKTIGLIICRSFSSLIVALTSFRYPGVTIPHPRIVFTARLERGSVRR
jgi:hypothetical protein